MQKTLILIRRITVVTIILCFASCQQQGRNDELNKTNQQTYREERDIICDELEDIFDSRMPANEKKVQNVFWGIKFGENVDIVFHKLKAKGFSPRFRHETSGPVLWGNVTRNPNCSYIPIYNGCQFANHSFRKANLYFTPAPNERFYAIEFEYVDDSRRLFTDILRSYPIQKRTEQTSKPRLRNTNSGMNNVTIPMAVDTLKEKMNNNPYMQVVGYSYKNGCELYLSADATSLVYFDNDIIKRDKGNASEL